MLAPNERDSKMPKIPDLVPLPFEALVRRVFRELERKSSIFDLPRSRFFSGHPDLDLNVDFHGEQASSPLGPAAGPQTQMAQNLVLSWLGGSRMMELKTVQINDRLEIPRPCIDVHTVGLNAEWSQELRLEESLEEYVKGAMLIEMLAAGPVTPLPGFGETVYDLSVGYDLEGIRSEPVQSFIRGMVDSSAVIDRLRADIPDEYREYRDLDFDSRLSNTVTLSTFHGCPPEEIERIMDFLLRRNRLHSIVKFNPMLLGSQVTRELLHDRLGYHALEVPESAFERDTTWQQAMDFVGRLRETADEVGLGFGAKFSNTLIVRNTRGFLAPDEQEVYLSGQPLHVLAIQLVQKFRAEFGDDIPISFAAGVDRLNFPDAVALGLVPITVCTDLLRKGGYGRLTGYYGELERRMATAGARSIDDFVLTAYGHANRALDALDLTHDDPRRTACLEALSSKSDLREAAGDLYAAWVSKARLLNTEHYAKQVLEDERYAQERNARAPKKIGRHLELFNCLTCDICVPVCPNDANFTLHSDQREIQVVHLERAGEGWSWRRSDPLPLSEKHQLANSFDLCNDCGNCDIFCPEDGGPYLIKPRFFGEETHWRDSPLDGFFVGRREASGDHPQMDRILGRLEGREFALERTKREASYSGGDFALTFDPDDPEASLTGNGPDKIDLTFFFILDYIRQAVTNPAHPNPVNARFDERETS